DTNLNADIFVRDLKTGTTAMASINSASTGGGNGFSVFPAISGDGRFVAFLSSADDLVASAPLVSFDVFVRDFKTGTTTLVSVNSAGTASGNGLSEIPVISANGRFVAFLSVADDLVPNDSNHTFDVFVRDLKTGTTTLVSVNSAGAGSGNRPSFSPAISADGRLVAFESLATDLVAANDTNLNF